MRRFGLFIVPLLLLAGSIIVGQSTVKNPHGNLKQDCQDCHTTDSWSKMRDSVLFDHATTGFPLLGAHAAAPCAGCHKSPIFSKVGTSCVDCHADQHHGQLGTNCENCHAPRNWENRQNNLDLHAARGFALTGAHAVADCEACHVGYARQEYAGTPVNCYGCHAETYAATTEPNHQLVGFSNDCATCHRAASGGWGDVDFIHSASFPLTGGHKGVACDQCHTTGYASMSTDCYSCHSTDFASTTDPAHEAGGFSHDCKQCHTIVGWQPARFDHNTTTFPLTGAHIQVACVSCHATQYSGTSTDCYSCHQTDFAGVTDPNHVQNNFSHTCTDCHTTSAWSPSSFDHSATGFALTGAHVSASCISCHSAGYAGTPSDCFSCHQTDFAGVTDPNHVQNNFSHTCTDCHTTTAWSPSSFDHSATGFALTGAHVNATCVSCHAAGYAGTPSDCYSCHQTDFAGVTDPNHVQNNFSHTCTDCHTTTAWNPTTFDHSTTGFVLTGAHASATCISCHSSGYAGTPADCYSCHSTDFAGVSDPNHVQNNFSHTCTDCHTTTAWNPTTFDHSTTGFALTGAHITASCVACHSSGYTGTPTACFACHNTDYQGTTDPNHTAAGFPTDCQTCHTTSGWAPANWDHDSQYFPIYSGTHAGRWSTCADCHVVPSSFATFECIDCHEHNRTDTDARHTGVRNYQYLSTACYSCHPTGRAG